MVTRYGPLFQVRLPLGHRLVLRMLLRRYEVHPTAGSEVGIRVPGPCGLPAGLVCG